MTSTLIIGVLLVSATVIAVILGTRTLAIRYRAVARFDHSMRGWWKSRTGRDAAVVSRRRTREPQLKPRIQDQSPNPSPPVHVPSRLDLDTRSVDSRKDAP